jgi:hypothetical protein
VGQDRSRSPGKQLSTRHKPPKGLCLVRTVSGNPSGRSSATCRSSTAAGTDAAQGRCAGPIPRRGQRPSRSLPPGSPALAGAARRPAAEGGSCRAARWYPPAVGLQGAGAAEPADPERPSAARSGPADFLQESGFAGPAQDVPDRRRCSQALVPAGVVNQTWTTRSGLRGRFWLCTTRFITP